MARSLRWRSATMVLAIGILMSGCGGDTLSLSEYVDQLNGINNDILPRAESLISELERGTTPGEVSETMAAMAALRTESVEATEALEPPDQIADLHRLLLQWENKLVPIEEAFADRAAAASGWPDLLESSEVAAYRVALVEGKQMCIELQETLDATERRGVFADTPWLPAEFSEVVDARLGCDLFPDDPDGVFQPVPPTPDPAG